MQLPILEVKDCIQSNIQPPKSTHDLHFPCKDICFLINLLTPIEPSEIFSIYTVNTIATCESFELTNVTLPKSVD